MRKKICIAVIVSSLFSGAAVAQTTDMQVDPDPGLIDASNSLYPAELFVDDILRQAGVLSNGDVVFERASEVSVAIDRNDSEAAMRAEQRLNQVAATARFTNATGLDKAEAVLEQVKERAPDEAQQGLDTALGNVRDARDRIPENVPIDNGDMAARP